MAPSAVVEQVKLDSVPYTLEGSKTPSPVDTVFASPNLKSSGTSVSTTWLKLNSNGPINVEVATTPAVPEVEPFSGAKKLKRLLRNTDELIVCPGGRWPQERYESEGFG